MAITEKDLENAKVCIMIKSLKKMSKIERFLLREEARKEKGIETAKLLDRLLERIEENETN